MIGMPMMRRRRRRRIIGTALVASSIARNNQRRRNEYEYQSRQQQQLEQQQREIDRLKAEQRARKRAEVSQPKVIYVRAPPPGYTAQHVQKVSGVQQIEYVQHQHQQQHQQPVLTKPKSNIVYVQKKEVQNVILHNPQLVTVPPAQYNAQVHPLVPAHNVQVQANPVQTAPAPVQAVQAVQTVQTVNRQLTQEQHNYVQPKPKAKIVYVEKPVEKIVYNYVDKTEKEQDDEPPPPESSGCCVVL